MKLSIIIVTYNTSSFLEACLLSLASATFSPKEYEVIVVDNASEDNPHAVVKKFPTVSFIQNNKNLGFAKANNIAIKKAKGDYVLFLNPDTIVQKDVLSVMLLFMDMHKDAGAATCRISLMNGDLDDASHRGFPTPWNAFAHFSGLSKIFPSIKLFNGYSLSWMDLSRTHEIDACAGAFMLVRCEAGEAVAWWDEDYFWYGEDIDFCFRLKQSNWKIYFVPGVEVLHHKGVSGGIKEISKNITTATVETRKRATKARFEAMRIFYRKHYIKKYPRFVTWFVLQAINAKERLTQ